MATPSPIQVSVVESSAEFAALANEWEALHGSAKLASVFGSFDWQHLWWRTYGPSRRLKLLVARSAGAIVGLLALHIETVKMLRLPVRLLRFVGTGGDTFPDDLGPVLGVGAEGQAARALADAIMGLDGWDVLLLSDMNPDCPFTAAMEAAARAGRLPVQTGRTDRIAFAKLPASWDAWLQSLSGDRRYRIRNIRKKLNAAHPSRFFVWDDPATLDQGIDRLIFLHHKRWKSINMPHSFATPEYVGFHRAVMAACLARNRLRLYCLEAGGQVVAMYYFYKFRDAVYLMQSGFDPDFSAVKPGQVLLGHIVEHAIGEGHKVLDFLKGDHRYKDELATDERETRYLTAFRWRPGAGIYHLRRAVLPEVKARLKKLVARVRPPAPDAAPKAS
jgi:CelD/BcsL family acetyltransferase involved in cellulose biosynthesis